MRRQPAGPETWGNGRSTLGEEGTGRGVGGEATSVADLAVKGKRQLVDGGGMWTSLVRWR